MPKDDSVKLVVGIFVAALMAAFLLPIAVGAITSPDMVTADQTTGETITLESDLTATLDSTDNTNGTATYTVSNDAGSATTSVSEGSTETVTVGDTDVSITLDSVATGSATTTYEYSKTYGWGTAGSLWVVLPILMVLAIFLFFVGMATRYT